MLGTVSPRVTPINSRDIDTGGGGDLSRATTAVVTHSQSQTDLDRRLDPEEGGRPEDDNDGDASSDDYDEDDDDDDVPEMKQLLLARKMKQMEKSLWHQLVTTCSYHNLKATMKWILDEATLRLSLNVWLQAATAISIYLCLSTYLSAVLYTSSLNDLHYAMLQFEDVTMLMTVYILFADDIKLLTLPRQVPTDLLT